MRQAPQTQVSTPLSEGGVEEGRELRGAEAARMGVACAVAHLKAGCLRVEIFLDQHFLSAMSQRLADLDTLAGSASTLKKRIDPG
jgi:hypothetical protein